MTETYTLTPKRKESAYGTTVVPGGIETPRPSELQGRDDLGRLGSGPDKFGGIRVVGEDRTHPGPSADEIGPKEIPDRLSDPHGTKEPLPAEKRGKSPGIRVE